MPRSAVDLDPLAGEFWDVVDDGLQAIALTLAAPARAAIEAHVQLLLAWNEHVNLTALRTAPLIARGHVLDALLAVPELRRLAAPGQAPQSVCDLGSGGGFPGLPLAVALSARRAALVDSIAKKAYFLAVAARAARDALSDAGGDPPAIDALAERAEDLADEPDQRETWDLVTARAVGSVAEVAELGLPLARRGGHVVAWKRDAGGGTLAEEVAQTRQLIAAAGGGRARIVALEAAERVGLAGHCLVVIDKRRSTPQRFPRPPGERRRAALR